MSYQIKLDKRARQAAKFISKLQMRIQEMLVQSGMTQQEVAERLGVDRSVINRRLTGKANLTARSIADFSYVFGKEIDIKFSDPAKETRVNWITSAQDKDNDRQLHLIVKNRLIGVPPETTSSVSKEISRVAS